MGELGADFGDGFDAAAVGQVAIHEGDVGLMLAVLLDGGGGAVGFGDDPQVAFGFERYFDAGADEEVIVHEEHTDDGEMSCSCGARVMVAWL